MATFYANPYGYGLSGFYFDSPEDYEAKLEIAQDRDPSGDFEHSIEFIDGDGDEAQIWRVLSKSEGSGFHAYELFDEIFFDLDQPHELAAFSYLVEDVGYSPKDALRKVNREGGLSPGSPEDYVDALAHDVGGWDELLGDRFAYYADLDSLARDFIFGGEAVELYRDVWLVNANDVDVDGLFDRIKDIQADGVSRDEAVRDAAYDTEAIIYEGDLKDYVFDLYDSIGWPPNIPIDVDALIRDMKINGEIDSYYFDSVEYTAEPYRY